MEPIINLKEESGGLQVAENAAQEITQGYVPPIVVVGIMPFDRIRDIAIFEQIADISPIEPISRVFYELNCAQRMERELSTGVNGEPRERDEPNPWTFIAPETIGDRLLKLICR
jgi:hypothetical protein